MFSTLKNIKNKANALLKAVFFHYKESNGLFDFFEKSFRYLRMNGLHSQQLFSKTFFSANTAPARKFFLQKFHNLEPFPTVLFTSSTRINIVIDSLAEDFFYRDTVAPIVFAILLANKLNCPLRVITRSDKSNAAMLLNLARRNGIEISIEYEIYNFPYGLHKKPSYRLPVSQNDIFIGTSWWSCMTIQEVSVRKQYIYMLQEDEKIFYPNGDEHVMIDIILSDKNMLPILSTHLLYAYFVENHYKHISKNGFYFEPAFSGNVPKLANKEKFNLLFYSRSNIAKNLFYTGFNLLESAVDLGIINTNEWNIFFVEENAMDFAFSDGMKPKYLDKLNGSDYLNFVQTIDLGIFLTITPTPGYSVLELATNGAIVLTNKYKNKVSLDNYSKNIICSDLDESSLLKNFELAVTLVKNPEKRAQNFSANIIFDDWEKSFATILEQLQYEMESQKVQLKGAIISDQDAVNTSPVSGQAL